MMSPEQENMVIAQVAHLVEVNKTLLETLEQCEAYLVERGIERKGVTGRTVILPAIRAALAKAKKGEAQ